MRFIDTTYSMIVARQSFFGSYRLPFCTRWKQKKNEYKWAYLYIFLPSADLLIMKKNSCFSLRNGENAETRFEQQSHMVFFRLFWPENFRCFLSKRSVQFCRSTTPVWNCAASDIVNDSLKYEGKNIIILIVYMM